MKECIVCKKPITNDQDYVITVGNKRIHYMCYQRRKNNE